MMMMTMMYLYSLGLLADFAFKGLALALSLSLSLCLLDTPSLSIHMIPLQSCLAGGGLIFFLENLFLSIFLLSLSPLGSGSLEDAGPRGGGGEGGRNG